MLAGTEVDHACLADLANWYIESGSAGLFTVAQSSEMYTLSPEERLACARTVKKAAAGRVPTLASGTFDPAGNPEEQAKFINEMAKEVDCVVLLVSMMAAKEESDQVWLDRCATIIELTPGVPLGIYECPAPYHRLLTPEMLAFCAGSGRFLFIKDTSRNNLLITKKIDALKALGDTPFKWFNGNVTTTLHSLKAGGDGYGGVSANFYPWVHAWLIENWEKEPEKAAKVSRFLTVAEMVVKSQYPGSAKTYLGTEYPGFAIEPHCRVKDFNFVPEDYEKLHELRMMMEDVCQEIGVVPVVPTSAAGARTVDKKVGAGQGAYAGVLPTA